jgi:hypothetical protein
MFVWSNSFWCAGETFSPLFGAFSLLPLFMSVHKPGQCKLFMAWASVLYSIVEDHGLNRNQYNTSNAEI